MARAVPWSPFGSFLFGVLKLVNAVKSIILAAVCLGMSGSTVWAQDGKQEGEHNAASSSVSFKKDVAPIIVAKCGKCHVSSSKGRYEIESYDALMNSDSIVPNDHADSNFIEVIESGEMPKGGLKVSDSELETLKQWVAQGAKFDGNDEKELLIKPGAGGTEQGGRGRRGRNGAEGRRGGRLQAVEQNPQAVGAEGVAWYVTWDTALAEAKRSNKPIFFMSAAAQCTGVSGVF